MEARITRDLTRRYSGKVAAVWTYSVSLDGAYPVGIGTGLARAESWAKRQGATVIVRAWEGKAVNPSYGNPNGKTRKPHVACDHCGNVNALPDTLCPNCGAVTPAA